MKHKSKKYSCDHCHTKLRFTANTAGFVAAIDALDYVICPVCTLALRNEEPEEDERFESASNDFPVGHEDLSEYQKWMKAEQERNESIQVAMKRQFDNLCAGFCKDNPDKPKTEPVEEAPKPAPALVELIGGHKRHDFVDADPNEDISSMIW